MRPDDGDDPPTRARMRNILYNMLLEKQPNADGVTRLQIHRTVMRVDENLYKLAHSKEDYANLDTLDDRLRCLVKFMQESKQLQQFNSTSQSNSLNTANSSLPRANSGNQRAPIKMVPTCTVAQTAPTKMVPTHTTLVAPRALTPMSPTPPGLCGGHSFSAERPKAVSLNPGQYLDQSPGYQNFYPTGVAQNSNWQRINGPTVSHNYFTAPSTGFVMDRTDNNPSVFGAKPKIVGGAVPAKCGKPILSTTPRRGGKPIQVLSVSELFTSGHSIMSQKQNQQCQQLALQEGHSCPASHTVWGKDRRALQYPLNEANEASESTGISASHTVSGKDHCALQCPSKKASESTDRSSVDLQPMAKRIKVELPNVNSPATLFPTTNITLVEALDSQGTKLPVEPNSPVDPPALVKKEEDIQVEKGVAEDIKVKKETMNQAMLEITEATAATKSRKPKIKGVALTEFFTPEQIKEHVMVLRQWGGQCRAISEKNTMEPSIKENSCQLCGLEGLRFQPRPIYCMPCGVRIRRKTKYYTMGSGDPLPRYDFCSTCYNKAHGDTIKVEGAVVSKAKFEQKKNDEETQESWVQCDKCEAWLHQICALFNGQMNNGGQAEYTCPNCYLEELEIGERQPLPQSSILGAKDLRRTELSDHIEQRLFRRLKKERLERARIQGKNLDEVPGAEDLVVRVVSSVDKKLEVKPHFLDMFEEDNFPSEFPYKSKVIVLFQKIEGVEVCLFGMFVQEFGSDCEYPNQRRVYLSYLDSVKYFRPEIKTVGGEALRTFVYHEIMIGYLKHCKKRGFTSCYIWSCPPLKGDDYILYCHPEIQKTPKADKLREWYLSMLKKAVRENIVVGLTNLYTHFFESTGECKAKVTAARVPYFSGDYWPGAAEDMLSRLVQGGDGRDQQKKGIKPKKIMTKTSLKAIGDQPDVSDNSSKDARLMQKLGETIYTLKEDYIMVHLQHPCTHCRQLIVNGSRWVCKQCKKFQLCSKCHDVEKGLDDRDRHPISSRSRHALYSVEITDVPADTKDEDGSLVTEYFDTRQAFLGLCQGNNYQYDTLRRAKHSSMMLLYHLHNPAVPAMTPSCSACHNDIEASQGWSCEICPEYHVCNACFHKDGGIKHPHKLSQRQNKVLVIRKILCLLEHTTRCHDSNCQYQNCPKVKGLFRHGMHCTVRAPGGCLLCKKIWLLLSLHARACKQSDCKFPRCKDLKDHFRRLQQHAESRRMAEVMEMARQRAAEVAENIS